MRSLRQRAALLSVGLAAVLAGGGLVISPTAASAAAATLPTEEC